MYGQPYLSLGIEHTAQVAPSHCKVGLSLNGFQVTSLQWVYIEKPQDRRRRGRMGGEEYVEGGAGDFQIKKKKKNRRLRIKEKKRAEKTKLVTTLPHGKK